MSVAAQVLLIPQTAAATTGQFARSAADGAFTIVAGGLGSSETVTLQIQDASGNWQTVPSAIAAQLTSTVAALTVNTPGLYRLSKTATAAAVGIVLYSI